MTNQEAFNIAVPAIIAQGERSADSYGSCLYRGPRGLKCAIGVLIEDENYKPEFESEDVETVITITKLGVSWLFAASLQVAHDGADDDTFVESFKSSARGVAIEHGLNTKVLNA